MIYPNATIAPVFGAKTTIRPNIWVRLRQMAELRKQRRDLSRLTADQLSDIGVSSSAAEKEAKRPVWDAPKSWTL